MQKFKVEPQESSKGASVQIKAESFGEAYRIYLSDHCKNGIPDCPIFVIVGGILGYKQLFHDHLEESARKEAEAALEEHKYSCLAIIEKLRNTKFLSLEKHEVDFLKNVLDRCFRDEELTSEEFQLVQDSMADDSAFRFFSLRSNSRSSFQQQAMLEAMNVNLSNISNKTSGVKVASMFTGMAAAKHLGEELAEDFGGGDE